MENNKRKEELSVSYLHALCAFKGISMELQRHDDDSMDVILKKTICLGARKYNAAISVQLKSTSTDYKKYDEYYSYPLKRKNYDDLRRQSTIKSFLFLLILPDNEIDWVTHSIEQLVIRKCMFWVDLEGLPDSNNNSTVTVHILKNNIVTSEVLDAILKNIAEEDIL